MILKNKTAFTQKIDGIFVKPWRAEIFSDDTKYNVNVFEQEIGEKLKTKKHKKKE